MDLYEKRRERLRKLIADDFDENQAAFSRHMGIKPSATNRWLSKTAAKIPDISEESAREIERMCNKPPGWLDTDNPMPLLSPQALKLAEIISSLEEPQQASIIHLVETTLEMQRQAALVKPT